MKKKQVAKIIKGEGDEPDYKDYSSLSSYQKLQAYVDELYEDEGFQEEIAKIRVKYKIRLADSYDAVALFKILNKAGGSGKEGKIYRQEIIPLAKKYGLINVSWHATLFTYAISNIKAIFKGPRLIETTENKRKDNRESDFLNNSEFPISVQISPYASKRDILDYIEQFYTIDIKPLQDKYIDPAIKIGKIRKKKQTIRERNKLIIEQASRKNKDIMSSMIELYIKTGDKAFDIDEGHIGKIKSLHKNKRKM